MICGHVGNYVISINADTDNTGGETLGSLQYRFVFKNVTTGVTLANVTFEQALTAAGFNAAQIAAFNDQSLYQDSINSSHRSGAASIRMRWRILD